MTRVVFQWTFAAVLAFSSTAIAQNHPPGAGPPAPPNKAGHRASPATSSMGNSADTALMRSCMDKLVQTNPTIKERYSDTILSDICRRNVEWQHTLKNMTQDEHATAARRANFTKSQLAWLQTVEKCQDPSCICRGKNGLLACDTSSVKFKKLNGTQFDHPLPRRQKRQQLEVDNTLQNRIGRSFRTEIRQMSDEDRNRYFRALSSLKFDRVDGLSKYDILIMYHQPEYSPEAHFSASFLPFHREMLKDFEIVLRMIDPGVSLPYWDPTMDAPLPNPADSVLWTSEFFGNGFGDVTSGPFRDWFALQDDQTSSPSRTGRIARNIGAQGSLMTDQDVNTILSKPRYRNLVFCVDPFLETAHGANHMWIGGHMLTLRISPNDPVFYNLHSFVDLIWEQWRQIHQNFNQRENDYVSSNEACNRVSTFNSRLQPFGIQVNQGLSNQYTQTFYTYSNRPECPECGSRYLFCDNRQNKCVSKVRSGGVCSGFEGFDVCYNSQCINGRCSGSGGSRPVNNNNNNNVAGGRGCRNNHACCVHWSRSGECNRNPSWMRSNCRSACGVCSGGTSCGDSDQRCVGWAAQGECQANPQWMTTSCPLSCGTCNADAGAAQCDNRRGGSTGVMCQNNDNRCTGWAGEGECARNPDWMLPNCALACNSC